MPLSFAGRRKVTPGCVHFQDLRPLSVRDNGVGIANRRALMCLTVSIKKIRAQYAGQQDRASIAKELIHGMGEKIEVTSEPERGANFHFTVKRS